MTAPVAPCSIPECNTDGTGEPCDRHETEQAHAAGEHEFCDVTCEVKFPSDQLRNFVVAKGYPGTAGMLAELERRAAQQAPVAPTSAPVELTTQYGLRLRDSTLLEFDTRAHRDRRMAEFVAAEWQVTPLTRQVRPAQYGEWTEEPAGDQRPPNPPHPGGTVYKTVADVDTFAAAAHHGQVDKIGVPYIEHVRAVAAGLAPFGDTLVIAGLLHDVLEDTDWTAGQLRAIGISARALAAVEAVTNQPGVPYEEKIRRITSSPDGILVKIADNAHNSHPDRAAQLPPEKRERLAAKYRAARAVLWPAAGRADIEAIIRIVNPALLDELEEGAS